MSYFWLQATAKSQWSENVSSFGELSEVKAVNDSEY